MSALILDTDPGVDDAMAIAFACAHPQIDLLALTTVFGNVSVGQATRNALTLLEQFDHSEIAVATGAAQPLIQDPLPFPEFVHGSDGLGNIHLPDLWVLQSNCLLQNLLFSNAPQGRVISRSWLSVR